MKPRANCVTEWPINALTVFLAGLLVATAARSHAQTTGQASPTTAPDACAADNGGITLSPGFCATVFADKLGHARHLAVAPNGVVYANTWSGRYFHNDTPPPGGFLIALQDTKGDGRADKIVRFGPTKPQGNAGGTGVAIYKGYLYAETNDRIVRYQLPSSGIEPTGAPETILSGLPLTGDHPMHPFAIDPQGNLYVDLGSATNSCQSQNRMPNIPGNNPCTELETRAGTWRYDANRLDQHFSPAERFATGLRNGEGISFDSAGRILATQHGRDQLGQNWPKLYTLQQNAKLPAEELVELKQGADFGWPECYYDGDQKKLVLAPEYGGDGGKAVGVCAQKVAPIAAFPAHWAPNDMLIYGGSQFPSAYKDGAFIAFHGSWNRAPTRRLQRGVPAFGRRQGFRAVRRFRRRLRRGVQGARSSGASPDWIGGRARWRTVHSRRSGWPHLAGYLPRREPCGRHCGGSALAARRTGFDTGKCSAAGGYSSKRRCQSTPDTAGCLTGPSRLG